MKWALLPSSKKRNSSLVRLAANARNRPEYDKVRGPMSKGISDGDPASVPLPNLLVLYTSLFLSLTIQPFKMQSRVHFVTASY